MLAVSVKGVASPLLCEAKLEKSATHEQIVGYQSHGQQLKQQEISN